MSTTVTVRDATSDNIGPITAIYAHHVESSLATLAKDIPSEPDMHKRINDIQKKSLPFLVAISSATDDEEIICGYAYADDWSARGGYAPAAEDTIYVHPDYQRGGIGKQLLKALVERLLSCKGKTQLLARMFISPGRKPEVLAPCRLHTSLSFKLVGRMEEVGLKLGQWVDVVIYQLDLGKLRAKGESRSQRRSVEATSALVCESTGCVLSTMDERLGNAGTDMGDWRS